MIKTLFYSFVLMFLSLSLLSTDAVAQKKKRLIFKKGVAVASGTIKGDQTIEYVFRVRKNADVDISVDDRNEELYPKFVLLKPNGTLFYDKDSVNYGGGTDLMDILPQAGDYVIRLQLPEEMRGDGNEKPVKFTIRVILK